MSAKILKSKPLPSITGFDAKAPPEKTAAFWAIVDANRPSEESELNDLLDKMNRPKAFTMVALQDSADGGLFEWLTDRKSRRVIPHRLEKCGYVPVRNPDASDGLWRHGGSRKVIYAKAELSLKEQLEDASDMCSKTGNF